MNQELTHIIHNATREHPINVSRIREIAEKSLDNTGKFDRLYSWLAMTGFFKTCLEDFRESQKELLAQYKDYTEVFLIDNWHKMRFPSHYPSENYGLGKNQLMAVIHGDIVRTGRLIFFLDPSPLEEVINPQKIVGISEGKIYRDDQDEMMANWEQHIRRLERILYVFANLNTGIGYMQGFNELIFPFYYVMTKGLETLDNNLLLAECLSFNLFQWLLTHTQIHEFYTTSDQSIIMHHLQEFVTLTKKHVPAVADAIESLSIHPLFYCLRWFTLLFSQEHQLPDLLGIWDSLLAHSADFMEYAKYVALGHLKAAEPNINKDDYTDTISALQNINVSDQKIKPLLQFARDCWEKDHAHTKTFLEQVASFFTNK